MGGANKNRQMNVACEVVANKLGTGLTLAVTLLNIVMTVFLTSNPPHLIPDSAKSSRKKLPFESGL